MLPSDRARTPGRGFRKVVAPLHPLGVAEVIGQLFLDQRAKDVARLAQEIAEIAGEQRLLAGDCARVPSRPGGLAGPQAGGPGAEQPRHREDPQALHHLARLEPLIMPAPPRREDDEAPHQRHGEEFDRRRHDVQVVETRRAGDEQAGDRAHRGAQEEEAAIAVGASPGDFLGRQQRVGIASRGAEIGWPGRHRGADARPLRARTPDIPAVENQARPRGGLRLAAAAQTA